MIQYAGSLFAVKDIKDAVAFYKELFGLEVAFDYGRCVTFAGGLSLQQDFDWLAGIPKSDMKDRENNCELYFETDAFEAFVETLKSRQDIVWLHDARPYDWGQYAIRFYDLDNHLIEVAESMQSLITRMLSTGMTVDAVAQKLEVTTEDVHKMMRP